MNQYSHIFNLIKPKPNENENINNTIEFQMYNN